MPLYSDSGSYYYSGGSSQLYSPYYSSGLSLPSSSSPSSYTSSYNRAYPGSYMVPLLPTPRSPSYTSSGSSSGSSSSSALLGLSSRYQPKLTTITESSGLTGRHSGHSSLMPLTRINSPKYTTVSNYTGNTSSNTSSSSSSRYIPARPIAINTADIDVSSARYRRTAERKPEPAAEQQTKKEEQQQPTEEKKEEKVPEQQQQQQETQQQQRARRSTIKRNRAVVRLSTIRKKSRERGEPQPTPLEQEHQFRDLPPAAEPSLSWRQKLADELAAFPTTSNKKSPGELLRERFYIHDEKQDEPAKLRHSLLQQPLQAVQQVTAVTVETESSQAEKAQQLAVEKSTDEEEEDELELNVLDKLSEEQVHQTIRRLSLVQCPTFHDICEDISSDKIDDDLNAGELRRRASIIQEQEQELLNKLQKSSSGSFQLIHLERRSSHDSNTDEAQSATVASKPQKKKSKKLRHKITAVVDVENAVLLQDAAHMPSVLELNEETTSLATASSPKPKFTVNVETVEEHHQIHKIFKLPKKKLAPKDKQEDATLPDGFMKAAPKAKTSPLKKANSVKKEQEEEPKEPQKPEQHVSVAQIFTFDEAAIKQNQTAGTTATTSTPTTIVTPAKTEGVATPKPIRKALQKSESGEDFWSNINSRETLYMSNRKKALVERQLDVTSEAAEDVAALATATTAKEATTPKLKTELVIELKAAAATPETTATTKPATSKSEAAAKTAATAAAKTVKPETATTSPKTATIMTEAAAATKLTATAKTAAIKAETATTIAKTTTTAATKTPPMSAAVKTETATSSPKSAAIKAATAATAKLTATTTSPKSTAIKAEAAATTTSPKTATIISEAAATAKLTATTTTVKPATTQPEAATTSPKSAASKPEATATCSAAAKTTATSPKTTAAAIAVVVKPKAASNLNKTEPATANTTTAATLISSAKSTTATAEPTAATTAAKTTASIAKLTTTIATKTATAADKLKLATTTAAAAATVKPTATVAASGTGKQSGNAASSTVVMTTASTTIAQTTGKSKPFETTPATTTAAAPKINTGQAAKSPEQQQAIAAATATAATKINKTTHNNERQQQQQPPQQQPLDNATTTTAAAATATTLKQQTENKSKLTEAAEPKSKVQSPKTTKPKSAGKTAANATAAAKKKVTTAIAATPTTTAAAAAAAATAATTPLPDINVTPINADQFITVAPTKAANAGTVAKTSPAATNASSPATTATATTVATIATTATTPTTTIAKIVEEETSQLRADAVATDATAAAAVVVDSAAAADNERSNSCDEGVGNNLSKFATVSNLAQCLRDVDAELEDYIPSSADDSDDNDDSTGDYSSSDGCANLSASMKKKQRKEKKKKAKEAAPARFDPQKKIKIDPTSKCYVKEEAPRYPLVATPRPLWKREKIVYSDENTDDESSEEGSDATAGSLEEESEEEESDECSSSSEEFDDEATAATTANSKQTNATTSISNNINSLAPAATSSTSASASSSPSIIRMSTCSNDSGFEGGTAPSSPKKMLECDVNCHKKCERLTANLCGVNQKLIVEALNHVKRGAREARDSPSTPPSSNPAYKIEANDEHDETSYTYSQFQKSGRFTAPATVIPRFKNYSVDDFHFLAVLGKGSFGKVLLAELRETTYYYAIKCLKKDVVLEDDDVDSTLIERKVLALGTKHPYLCHLFCTFQTESHLFFVMEYLNGGDLMFHIQESGRFSEERARFYGAEIISGLKFLHKKGIIYRDLKLDNVLLDYEGHVRIADFGMCKLQIYLDKTADSFCGTPDYMAPEIIKGEKYNQNVDWWSFGVLLYEMLIGQSPFSGCDEDELFWSICNEIPWFPVYISAEATGILRGLLEKDYTKRIGSQYSPAGDIADHIFFRPIDWNLLEKRQIEPPFRPQVKHPLDTQYFDRVFTRERVRLTPIDKDILASMDQKQFHGFTYTNPHITLD